MEITGVEGRTALITGSSKGIGRACAITLARAGADVVVNHRDSETEALEVKSQIERLGRRAIVVKADAGDPEQVEDLFDQAAHAFGGVDIAVSNAVFTRHRMAVDLDFRDWKRAFAVNVDAGFILGRRTGQDLIRRGAKGRIIYISSILAIHCRPGSIAYNTTKSALRGMAYSLASEFMEHEITVNVIQPGSTNTPGERRFLSEERIAELAAKMPFGRMASPQDVANVVLFLASDLGSFVNGQTIRVDSGQVLGRVPAPPERW